MILRGHALPAVFHSHSFSVHPESRRDVTAGTAAGCAIVAYPEAAGEEEPPLAAIALVTSAVTVVPVAAMVTMATIGDHR